MLKKLGHHLSVFNRIFYKLDNKTRIAYFNGLVLPHLDYGDIVWGDQPSLKSEMDHLQAFQNKRILDNKISSSKALNSLQWIPLAEQRFAHQWSAVQDAIKGEIPEHLETFKITLRDLRGHNTRNSYLPRIPNPKTECGKRTTHYRYISDWSTLPNFLRKPIQ